MLGFHRPEKTRGAGSVKSTDQAKGGVGLTFKFVILLATILCPSAGLVGIGRYRLAITYLASLMSFFSLFILLRLIYHPAAVVLLLILTFSVHVFSLLHAFRLVVSAHLLQLSLIKAVSSLVLGLLFLLMLLVIIYEKKNLLGLDVYRIYSYSMHPTLQERDWIIADWLGRQVLFPQEIPAGLIASLLGGSYFIWGLRRY